MLTREILLNLKDGQEMKFLKIEEFRMLPWERPGCWMSEIVLLLLVLITLRSYHTMSGLKQHDFILLLFWRPEVRHEFHWARIDESTGHALSEAARGESIPLPLQLLELHCLHSLACGLFLHLQSQQGSTSL